MAANGSPRPTDAELEILNVMWSLGACTVRQVHEAMSQSRDLGYTTILKQMQMMFEMFKLYGKSLQKHKRSSPLLL